MAILGIEPGTGSPLGVTATCTCEEVKPDTVPSRPVSSMKLGPVIPNPGVPPMSVHLSLTTPMPVEAGVFDLNGRRLRTLLSGTQPAGERDVAWDGHDDAGRGAGQGPLLPAPPVGRQLDVAETPGSLIARPPVWHPAVRNATLPPGTR
jgi:hypothetical protein